MNMVMYNTIKPLLILLLSFAGFSSCISKKTLLETSADYETRISLVREELLAAQKQIQSLQLQLAEKKGENNALTAMQDKLQDKIDRLESELSSSSSQAVDLEKGLKTVIQINDSIKNAQQQLLSALDSILENRNVGLEILRTHLQDSLQSFPANAYSLVLEDQQLRLILNERTLFKAGPAAKVELSGRKILESVANVLALHPKFFVLVVGHHDNQPLKNKLITDSWDFSTLRAAEVARILVRDFEVSSARLTAAGKGPYSPLVSNETTQGQASNRRVEIVIFPAAEELPKTLREAIKTPG